MQKIFLKKLYKLIKIKQLEGARISANSCTLTDRQTDRHTHTHGQNSKSHNLLHSIGGDNNIANIYHTEVITSQTDYTFAIQHGTLILSFGTTSTKISTSLLQLKSSKNRAFRTKNINVNLHKKIQK